MILEEEEIEEELRMKHDSLYPEGSMLRLDPGSEILVSTPKTQKSVFLVVAQGMNSLGKSCMLCEKGDSNFK